MNLRPIINEMRAYWLEGQTGGQLLIGGQEAHYNADKTPDDLVFIVQDAVCRERFQRCDLWEIEALEQDNVVFYEFLVGLK
jgi:hypothetical protein